MPKILSKKPDKATLSGLIKLFSLREIAKKYDVSAKTVCKWCQKDQLKVTRKSKTKDINRARVMKVKSRIFTNTKKSDCFFAANGAIISNLYDLSIFLSNVEETIFHIHVNQHKNDFFEWIMNVLRDEQLAFAIKECSERVAFKMIVDNHIIQLLKETIFSV
ncbi:MAG: hypothetical protein K9N07_11400 [Candidatus Cloacimonetes bacterium]|nr:hypothetical protein [Candidatus Cloacimonadota bacterium]